MGVSIFANNRKCPIEFDMGYGAFFYLRKEVGDALAISAYETWLKTDDNTPKDELHRVCERFHTQVGDAAYNFLTQSDCEGELSYKQCGELYDVIKDIKVNGSFGYIRCVHSFEDFKELLKYCYSHRTKLVWR